MPASSRPHRFSNGIFRPFRGLASGCWLMLCALHALALDLNQATEAQLDNLSGFGPTFSARVMQARAERPFTDWSDFMRRVKGVREATAWRLSQQGIRIQQVAYTPASPPATRR